MKCMSCTAEIPPAWVHAINSNSCPGCGGNIMDSQAQTLLAEVRDAMNQMSSNPEGLAGWLLSNYKLQKVGDAEPTGFHQRSAGEEKGTYHIQGNANSSALAPAANAPNEGTLLFQQFLKRTGVKLPDASAMKKAAGTTAIMDIGDDEGEDIESDESIEFEGNDLPFTMPGAGPADPRSAIQQKQKDARRAIMSGSGGFRRG